MNHPVVQFTLTLNFWSKLSSETLKSGKTLRQTALKTLKTLHCAAAS